MGTDVSVFTSEAWNDDDFNIIFDMFNSYEK